jgi:hypothetical protein
MDTAGAVDAQNAPTAPWKTAQNAVSHSPHASSSIRLTHEIPDTPRIRGAAATTNLEPRTEPGTAEPNLEPWNP